MFFLLRAWAGRNIELQCLPVRQWEHSIAARDASLSNLKQVFGSSSQFGRERVLVGLWTCSRLGLAAMFCCVLAKRRGATLGLPSRIFGETILVISVFRTGDNHKWSCEGVLECEQNLLERFVILNYSILACFEPSLDILYNKGSFKWRRHLCCWNSIRNTFYAMTKWQFNVHGWKTKSQKRSSDRPENLLPLVSWSFQYLL